MNQAVAHNYGRIPVNRTKYYDLSGTCFSAVAVKSGADPMCGQWRIRIQGDATHGYKMIASHDRNGDSPIEKYVTVSTAYSGNLLPGLDITTAAAFATADPFDRAIIEVSDQQQFPAGTQLATVTSAAGAAVATGEAFIHGVTLVPQGNPSDRTITIYDYLSAGGTVKIDAVPILDDMGVRHIPFIGARCAIGIYAVVSGGSCHVIVEFSQ